MPKKKWYSEGLNFECQGSGKCCVSRGEYGYVYLTEKDGHRLADHFKMDIHSFVKEHCAFTDENIHLNSVNVDCKFLDGTKCSVYEARPQQCRTWPFYPENLKAKKWKEVAAYCPGIGKGKLYTQEEIEYIASKMED